MLIADLGESVFDELSFGFRTNGCVNVEAVMEGDSYSSLTNTTAARMD